MAAASRIATLLLTTLAIWMVWASQPVHADGPAALGADTQPVGATPKIGDPAPDFTLQSLSDQPVHLAKLTAQSPVVLLVLRGWPGYQCPICTRQVGEFIARAQDLPAAKVQVVLVYPGPAEQLKAHAQEFVSGKSIPANFTFVLDPDYQFTNRYNLRWNAAKETAYPSTFVIDRTGTVRLAKVSRSHGDRAMATEVLKALAEIK